MSQSLELFVDDKFEDQFRWNSNTSDALGMNLTGFMSNYFQWNVKTPDYGVLLNRLLEDVIEIMLDRQKARDKESVRVLHDLISFLLDAQREQYHTSYLIYNP